MSALIDPTSGQKLPVDSIQRVLFVSPKAHVYNPPPLTSNSGHLASTWTGPVDRKIFTARLRILETAIPLASGGEKLSADILLEDGSSGELFAAAPYKSVAVVEQVVDSSRFFALRVQDPSGRKATLGLGFEERSEAFDFGIALQEVRKGLNIRTVEEERAARRTKKEESEGVIRDFSLKEGETITVKLGGKVGKGRRDAPASSLWKENEPSLGFSLPPPPGGAQGFELAPPPSAQEIKAQQQKQDEDSGFDDGEFGEFQ